MPLPNVIIAGPPKSGTTSVFRYLAAHPEVCPSSIKEIHYFERFLDQINDETLSHYESHFSSCNDRHKVRLEASPRYLQGGNPVARAIHSHVPDAKLVFILREPVERFLSRYISLVTKTDRIGEQHLSLDKLVDEAISHPNANPDPDAPDPGDEIVEYLWQGCYADFIDGYIDICGIDSVSLLFFDDLKQRPKVFMQELCSIIGIDADYYNDFQFRIENKTRTVRYAQLHKTAEKLNRSLEFIQNRFPYIRRLIKTAYYSLLNPETNETDKIDTSYARRILESYYRAHNKRLLNLLKTRYNKADLPAWLSDIK